MSAAGRVSGRRARSSWIAAAVAGLIVVVVGVIVVVHLFSSGSKKQLPELAAILDRVPLPPGTTLVTETSTEAHGDVTAYLERHYRLGSATASSVEIRAALQHGGTRLVDLQTGQVESVDAQTWSAKVGASTGDVYVLPKGTSGGGVEMLWKDDQLYLSVKAGDVH